MRPNLAIQQYPIFNRPTTTNYFTHKKCVDAGLYRKQLPTSFAEGIQHLAQWVKEGKLQFTETFVQGFDQLPAAFLSLFKGDNTGKMIVQA